MNGHCTFTQLGRHGRLCNQVYQIAGTIGIARKNLMEPLFPVWRNYDHLERFGSKEDINVFEHFVNPLPSLEAYLEKEQLPVPFINRPVEWGYHNIVLPPGNWDIQGHLQSLHYFEHCIDEVRHYMTMYDEPKITQPYIAIHARRSDYDNKYHPVIPIDWYCKAIKHFPAVAHFLLFSDDPKFISDFTEALDQKGMSNYASNMIQYNGDYLSSFALMKKCEHFIIANSSFSAAAATLAEGKDKQVIAPKTWFGAAYAGITGNDIYCNGWVVI